MRLDEATIVVKKVEIIGWAVPGSVNVRLHIERRLDWDELRGMPNGLTVEAVVERQTRCVENAKRERDDPEYEPKAGREELATKSDIPVGDCELREPDGTGVALFRAGGEKVKVAVENGLATATWVAEAWVAESILYVLARCAGKNRAGRLTMNPIQQDLPGTVEVKPSGEKHWQLASERPVLMLASEAGGQ